MAFVQVLVICLSSAQRAVEVFRWYDNVSVLIAFIESGDGKPEIPKLHGGHADLMPTCVTSRRDNAAAYIFRFS